MGEFLYSAVGFVVALGILVTVHEFGHFWVARKLGVKVLKFSVGFGRPIWSRTAGPDNTEYAVGAIPLGGYVKMLDENEDEAAISESELPRAFNRQALWKRTSIVLAGPMFNFIFAMLAYWIVFSMGVDGIRPVVGKVVEDSIAAAGGFKAGDEITHIDGRPNRSWDEQRLYLYDRAFSRTRIDVDVIDSSGAVQKRVMDLSGLPLHQINPGLLESGIGLIGYLPDIPAQIGTVEPGSPAELAGLRTGDSILSIDGNAVSVWQDMVVLVQERPGKSAAFEVMRDGQKRLISIIPERVDQDGRVFGRIGIRPAPIELPDEVLVHVEYGPIEALGRSAENVWIMSSVTLKMLWKILRMEVSAKNISGPLTIAQYAGQTVRIGVDRFLLFLAVVSISLGVINLLPIPLLDGGHLVYYAIELVTGGPVSKQVMLWGQQIGIVALFGLMSLAFYNDIVRLFG
jgi:regulator of sigma E protease